MNSYETHDTGDATRERLGANLRRLRIARRLSLSQLARDTSISKATLSGIESGRGNPTVETLSGLAGALRVSIGELLEPAPLAEIRIVRAAETRTPPPSGSGDGFEGDSEATRRLLESTDRWSGSLELFELALPARSLHLLEPRTAGARERILVLEGKLIAGPNERISELVAGDYASFPADVEHLYETRATPARVLVLVCSPG